MESIEKSALHLFVIKVQTCLGLLSYKHMVHDQCALAGLCVCVCVCVCVCKCVCTCSLRQLIQSHNADDG